MTEDTQDKFQEPNSKNQETWRWGEFYIINFRLHDTDVTDWHDKHRFHRWKSIHRLHWLLLNTYGLVDWLINIFHPKDIFQYGVLLSSRRSRRRYRYSLESNEVRERKYWEEFFERHFKAPFQFACFDLERQADYTLALNDLICPYVAILNKRRASSATPEKRGGTLFIVGLFFLVFSCV